MPFDGKHGPRSMRAQDRFPFDGARTVGGARVTMDIGGTPAGVANLPQALTINSQTVSPAFWYEAENATLSDWTATVGADLAATGSGGEVGHAAPTPYDSGDLAVSPEATRQWRDPGTTGGDLATEDAVFALLVRHEAEIVTIAAKRDSTGGDGWELESTANQLRIALDGPGGSGVAASSVLVAGNWYLSAFVLDASGSCQPYLNGDRSGTPLAVSSFGSYSNSKQLSIGSASDLLNPSTGRVAWIAAWYKGAWLDSHLQDAAMQEMFHRICGTYSETYGGPVQSLMRNSAAFVEKPNNGGQVFVPVGINWPRIDTRYDKRPHQSSGYAHEKSTTNFSKWSNDISNAAWTKTNVSAPSSIGEGPFQGLNAFDLSEDGTAGEHSVSQAVVRAVSWSHSVAIVKPSNRWWVCLEVAAGADSAQHFYDLGSQAVGTVNLAGGASSNNVGYIRYLGGGWYFIQQTDILTVANPTIKLYACDDDNSLSFTGGTQESLKVAHLAFQSGPSEAKQPHLSTTAAVSQLSDRLQYDGVTLGARGTISSEYLSYLRTTHNLVSLNLAGSTNDEIKTVIVASLNAQTVVTDGGVEQANISEPALIRHLWQEVRATYQANDVKLLVDGDTKGTDVAATIPSLDRIEVGSTAAGTGNSALHRFRLFNQPTTRAPSAFGTQMGYLITHVSSPAAAALNSSTFVNIAGTWTLGDSVGWSLNTSTGLITKDAGTGTEHIHIIVAIAGSVSTGSPLLTAAVEHNGTPIEQSKMERSISGSGVGAWAMQAALMIAPGDTINVAALVSSGTPNFTADRCTVHVGTHA